MPAGHHPEARDGRRSSATIREVAVLAGVSPATAARALNRYGSVSAATIRKVSLAADQLGYRTNPIAQALRRGHANYVGFLPGDLENPFFATVARALGDAVEEAGYTLTVSSSDERLDREQKIVDTLQANLVSALVVAPVPGHDRSHLTRLAAAGIPLVIVDRAIPGLAADTVTVDNRGGARAGVEHLLDRGHRRVGFVSDVLEIASSQDRLQGYRDALSARGFVHDPDLQSVAQPSRDGGYRAALALLDRRDPPSAVFAADNLMTLGVLRAAGELGLRIPEELSLVGFDDFDLATAVRPTITTVAQPVAEIGRRAGALLLRRLEGWDGPAEHVNLPTRLIVRESSGGESATSEGSGGRPGSAS
ncbi:LacI family DNA-binding transcriptional regulator [Naasia sp. SYSU D00057]|uniref:LacI family DNA-binding transcriptional regulator n=1 Tax=Naasia sp. SYSU D00057 TaxID=2817380 RepID=UPI001B306F3E|nr:LacI family DNA-binding transcriptional regulator [Naasia sp. SYSU D00057]